MAKLFLIRHGESIKTDKDTILSKKGIKQAKLLAKKLSSIKITKVYVSDHTRALQTYNQYYKLKPKINGIKTEKLREIYRVIVGGPIREGTDPNRKRIDLQRANNIFNQIISTSKPNDSIALFIHGNIIRYFIAKVLNLKKINLWEELVIDNASISIIEIKDKLKSLKMINNIDHLSKKEVNEFYNDSIETNYFN